MCMLKGKNKKQKKVCLPVRFPSILWPEPEGYWTRGETQNCSARGTHCSQQLLPSQARDQNCGRHMDAEGTRFWKGQRRK